MWRFLSRYWWCFIHFETNFLWFLVLLFFLLFACLLHVLRSYNLGSLSHLSLSISLNEERTRKMERVWLKTKVESITTTTTSKSTKLWTDPKDRTNMEIWKHKLFVKANSQLLFHATTADAINININFDLNQTLNKLSELLKYYEELEGVCCCFVLLSTMPFYSPVYVCGMSGF